MVSKMIGAEADRAGLALNRLLCDADRRPVALKVGADEVWITKMLRNAQESKAHREHDKTLIIRDLLRSAGFQDYVSAEPAADKLGRPYALTETGQIHGISFSRDLRYTWGALCESGALGIDASALEEFSDPYPFHRAFAESELRSLNSVQGPEKSRLAALVWSAKEAAVKMLGHGFHVVDPKKVRTDLLLDNEINCISEVFVGKRPGADDNCDCFRVYSFIVGSGWLSIAVNAGKSA